MISIVNSDIVKKYDLEGSIFLYKEALPRDVERLYQSNQISTTSTFNLDICTIRDEILTKYIVGWEKVVDSDGKDVSFNPTLLAALPTDIRNKLFALITTGKVS